MQDLGERRWRWPACAYATRRPHTLGQPACPRCGGLLIVGLCWDSAMFAGNSHCEGSVGRTSEWKFSTSLFFLSSINFEIICPSRGHIVTKAETCTGLYLGPNRMLLMFGVPRCFLSFFLSCKVSCGAGEYYQEKHWSLDCSSWFRCCSTSVQGLESPHVSICQPWFLMSTNLIISHPHRQSS